MFEETEKHFALSTLSETLHQKLGMTLHTWGTMAEKLDEEDRLRYLNELYDLEI